MKVQYVSDSEGKPTGVIIPIDQWEALKNSLFEQENDQDAHKFSEEQKKAIHLALEELKEGKAIAHDEVMRATKQRYPEYFKS